jgi:hypothetical protein
MKTQSKQRRLLLVCSTLFITVFVCTGMIACSQKNPTSDPSKSNEQSTISSQSLPIETTRPTLTATPSPIAYDIDFPDVEEDGNPYGDAFMILPGNEFRMILGGDKPIKIEDATASSEIDFYGMNFREYWISAQAEDNIDGSIVAFMTNMDDTNTGDLIYYDGTSAAIVSKNVDSFHMSNDGSTIAYLTGKYEHGIGDSLYLYDCTSGESVLVSEGAGRLFTLSPGGDALAYTTFYEVDNVDALNCYYSLEGGTSVLLGKDMYCIALTDNGDTQYCVKISDSGQELYAFHAGVSTLLCESYQYTFETIPKYLLNDDASQIVFSNASQSFVSVDGCVPVPFSEGANVSFADAEVWYENPAHLTRVCSDKGRRSSESQYSGTYNLCNVIFRTTALVPLSMFDNTMKIQVGMSMGDFDVPSESIYILLNNSENQWTDLYVKRGNALQEKLITNVNSVILRDNKQENGEPDTVYFLVIRPYQETTEDTPHTDQYPYGSLYSLEDIPGAEPILVAEKVCDYAAGDFGVIYKKYKSDLRVESDYASYRDACDIYYSPNGDDFKKVMTQNIMIQIGG